MFPIILAHGIARFDILRQKIRDELNLPDSALDDELQYFRNVRTHLNADGFSEIFNTNVDFAGSLDLRAGQLKNKIEEVLNKTGAAKVHVVAHSMGGLDARLMIVDLEMADRVASLTTVGTPHLGTVLADHVVSQGGNLWIDFLDKALRLNLEGLHDLTTIACEAFNRRAENIEAKNPVVYQTYSSFERGTDVFLPLLPSWFFIQNNDGKNDGLVSVRSQQWKNELVANDGTVKRIAQKEFPLPADHLNQVGWWDWEEAVSPIFGGTFQNQRNNYETRIKNLYLETARDLRDNF